MTQAKVPQKKTTEEKKHPKPNLDLGTAKEKEIKEKLTLTHYLNVLKSVMTKSESRSEFSNFIKKFFQGSN